MKPVGMQIGKLVVTVVKDLLVTKVSPETAGSEHHICKRQVQPHLLHVAGIFKGNVFSSQKKSDMSRVKTAMTNKNIGTKPEGYKKQLNLIKKISKNFTCYAAVISGQTFVTQPVMLQQFNIAFFPPCTKQYGMSSLFKLHSIMPEQMHMRRMAYIYDYIQNRIVFEELSLKS
jgi:hypothetical protein